MLCDGFCERWLCAHVRQDFERPPALGAQTRKQKTGIQWMPNI
jgi:hypothetical protein